MKSKIIFTVLIFSVLFIAVAFAGCLSAIGDTGSGDPNDPYRVGSMQKMFNRPHTNVQIRLHEIPEQRWSVGVEPAGVLRMSGSGYVSDEYIFNEVGYHKWVFEGIQPGTATVTFSYDYNGKTITKYTLTVYVDEEDLSLRIYDKK